MMDGEIQLDPIILWVMETNRTIMMDGEINQTTTTAGDIFIHESFIIQNITLSLIIHTICFD